MGVVKKAPGGRRPTAAWDMGQCRARAKGCCLTPPKGVWEGPRARAPARRALIHLPRNTRTRYEVSWDPFLFPRPCTFRPVSLAREEWACFGAGELNPPLPPPAKEAGLWGYREIVRGRKQQTTNLM
eukprot:scaffold26721_cov84-Isochrysis_galbana.AAC.2